MDYYHSFPGGYFIESVVCTHMVMVKAVVTVAMMEVGLVLPGLERGNIGGEREGDGGNARVR